MEPRVRDALALCLCASTPVAAAPELLGNGGGERPIRDTWTVLRGNARTTGLIRDENGGALAPSQGMGFIVVGPGGASAIMQAGGFPFGSERLFLSGHVRAPGGASGAVILRAFDIAGDLTVERSVVVGTERWDGFSLTYAIPPGSRTWELVLETDTPGAFGVHADALMLIGTCVADINGDRLLNFFDITTYLALFQAGDPEADLTGNGTIDFFDISELLDSFQFICE